VWRDFADILVSQYNLSVTLVDLRGHGDSPHAEHYQLSDFAADLIENLPVGVDFLIGQSLGGRAAAEAMAALLPGRYIGLDPAFDVGKLEGWLLGNVGPFQPRMPDWLLRLLQFPPKGAAADVLERRRKGWETWDPKMMRQLAQSSASNPFLVGPPAVPATLVLADKSFAVSAKLASQLSAAGWDVRVKDGAVHELHVQDPAGVVGLLDDLLTDGANRS
jgi:pimeloyl-ACP methyl ester carboxylesterase